MLSTSIALIVYKVGYGFDPFIHRASENLIAQQGFISPKTFYYVGQYSLVAMLSKLLAISPAIIDKLLVPLFFSLIVPLLIYFTCNKLFENKKYNVFLAIAPLSLPYATYIVTTPQAFANIFTLAAILISQIYLFGKRNKQWLFLTGLFTITAIFIHPLAGLPALIFLLFVLCIALFQNRFKEHKILKKLLFIEIIFLSAIVIPVTFLINSIVSQGFGTILDFTANIKLFTPYLKNNFNAIYDIVYLYDYNLYIAYIIFAIIGLAVFRKKIQNGWLYMVVFLIIFINYFILSNFVQFTFLPENERGNYSQRLFEVSLFLLIPYALLLLHRMVKKIQQKGVWLSIALVVAVASSLTISVYASYPRDDDYRIDRGYNVTQDDIQAVRLISEQGQGKDYIVLSSPVTAAAALNEFGFHKYYNNHFYYSIPTGGPLHEYYMEMVSTSTSAQIAQNAMDFVGVDTSYFVINKYWWKSEVIVERAKQDANEWFSVNNGQVYVFEYEKEKDAEEEL